MKHSLMFAGIMLAASFLPAHAQNSCLVISQKHNARVDSIGDVPFKSHYSDRMLKHLAARGTRIVEIPSAKQFVSASEVCGMARTIEMPVSLNAMAQTVAQQPEGRRCVEMITHVDGSENCVTWTSLPSPQQQH